MFSNISQSNATNLSVSHRQPKFFFGPLLGVFLANILSNSVLSKFAPLGSIRLEYDPLPFLNLQRTTAAPLSQQTTQKPQTIEILNNSYHTQRPEVVEIINHSPEPPTTSNEYLIHDSDGNNYFLESPPEKPIIIYNSPGGAKEGFRDESTKDDPIHSSTSENIPVFSHYPDNQKNHVKRQAHRYRYNRYVRNRYSNYMQRRRYTTPDYFEDDSYEDYNQDFGMRRYYRPTTNKRRYQNGRRPINFDDEYEDYLNNFDYDIRPVGKPQRKNQSRIKKINKKGNLGEEESEFDDDVESIDPTIKPRQRQTTTRTPETTQMTNITTGITAPSNETYGYGPSNGNENISITYAPPSAQKPVYGPPNSVYGVPEYNPSSLYGFTSSTFGSAGYPSLTYGTQSISSSGFTPIQSGSTYNTLSGSYGSPSTSYGSPSSSYGAPSTTYAKPSAVYGSPSSSYGTPDSSYSSSSNAYGAPSTSYGSPPSTSYGSPGGYQSYQVPYSNWYKKGSSRVELARRAQDILSYDGLFKNSFKK